MLALAGAFLVAGVVFLLVSKRKEETPEPDDEQPEPEAPSLAAGLARAQDATSVARALVDEVVALLEVEFAAVMLISDDRKEATGLVARMDGEDADWVRSVQIDLEHEPSAVASAAFEAAPLTIFEVESSPRVSRRLADRVGAKSAAFVPVVSGARVLAVLIAASTNRRRTFPPSEIARLEALAGETALALEKTRSAAQLEEALGRERLVAEIARRVRSEHDVGAVLRIAVEEVGKATDVSRCFIRLGEPGAPTPIRAEWESEALPPIGADAPNLAVSNLATG
jgi:GAF domain-containing protein